MNFLPIYRKAIWDFNSLKLATFLYSFPPLLFALKRKEQLSFLFYSRSKVFSASGPQRPLFHSAYYASQNKENAVCPPVCLPHSMTACLPACMTAWLSACLHVCLPAFLTACLPACLPCCLLPTSFLPAWLPAWLPVSLDPCLPTCLRACLFPASLTPSLTPSLPACQLIFFFIAFIRCRVKTFS